MLIRLRYSITAPANERWAAYWEDECSERENVDEFGTGKDPTNAIIDLLDNYDMPDLEISL